MSRHLARFVVVVVMTAVAGTVAWVDGVAQASVARGPEAALAATHQQDRTRLDASVARAGFTFRRYATVQPASGWSFVAGQFAGDNKDDVVGYHPSNGSLWVGRNTGSAFSFTQYATVQPASGWSFVAGQFAGDNKDDVVGYHPSNGSLWVGRNTG